MIGIAKDAASCRETTLKSLRAGRGRGRTQPFKNQTALTENCPGGFRPAPKGPSAQSQNAFAGELKEGAGGQRSLSSPQKNRPLPEKSTFSRGAGETGGSG